MKTFVVLLPASGVRIIFPFVAFCLFERPASLGVDIFLFLPGAGLGVDVDGFLLRGRSFGGEEEEDSEVPSSVVLSVFGAIYLQSLMNSLYLSLSGAPHTLNSCEGRLHYKSRTSKTPPVMGGPGSPSRLGRYRPGGVETGRGGQGTEIHRQTSILF